MGFDKITVTVNDLYKIYFWGMSEGQILMEEERDSEETFDAFLGAVYARKICLPNNSVRRRQVHSKKWFETMRKAKQEFNEFLKTKIDESS